MKASDIADADFLRLLDRERWTQRWDIHAAIDAPEKIVLAKARRLIKRGLMDGCYCGCRGDFVLTTKGAEYLAGTVSEAP